MIQDDIIKGLKTIHPDKEYYAITLTGTAEGKMGWTVYSHWAGWVNDKPGREIREASIVNATYMADGWEKFGEGYIVVNNITGFLIYVRYGGNALVEKELCGKYFSEIIRPHETAYDGALGFKSASNLEPHVFKRATRPKHRMRIIKRDRYRCRICGRSPDNYSDIELHVHHIRPWEKGGLTEDENLITLCDTCHDGLQPHADPELFQILDSDAFRPNLPKRKKEYIEGVRLYRDYAKRLFSDLEKE